MTITIDCRMLNASGVGVYLCECLPYFLKSNNQFVLFGDSQKLTRYCESLDVPGTIEIAPCTVKPFSPAELLRFPRSLLHRINRCDIYYSPYFNIPAGITIPVYTTIHDIIFPDMPELTSKTGLAMRMWFYRRAFRLSRAIFTVSQFSASRITHYAKKAKRDIPLIVTHSAIQPFLLEPNERYEKNNTILFVGNIKKHKGLHTLLHAFSCAKKAGLPHKLVIVGSRENFRTRDDSLAHYFDSQERDIVFAGAITNAELKRLYAESSLLVQPSLYEGFGLPPLEAMALHTPALISDIPVFREIYADFPVTFFTAGDSEDLCQKLLTLLQDSEPLPVTLSDELQNRYTFAQTASIILTELIGGEL